VAALGILAETHPRRRELGAYLHIPFCESRCHYCAFNTAPLEMAAMRRLVAALLREIDLAAAIPWARDVTLGSVFFGGGTPSLLEPDDLGAIVDRLRRHFAVAVDAEMTVECNPESVTRPKLEAYRAAGVNRVSLGVQSLDDRLLGRIGRRHRAAGARQAYDEARGAGLGNVSVDLMYGLPGLDVDGFAQAVETVLDWAPDHLSAYGLSLDAGSLWGAVPVDGLPPEETVVAQYWTLARAAARRGYDHYEISNYARAGFRSRHNLNYWRRGEYLAFGPGAAGFAGDTRWTNVKPVARYAAEIEDGRLPIDAAERLTPRQALAERLILGLRTADGVPASRLAERTDGDARLAARVTAWCDAGLLAASGDRVRLTEAGFLLSDSLFVELT
jgi:putative oxygen-independent coproporphyrinogen III oxidase